MTQTDFTTIDGHTATVITADNNPAPDIIKPTPGGLGLPSLYFVTSTKGLVYIYDGSDAIYLALERVMGGVNLYTIAQITQDITEFTALLND